MHSIFKLFLSLILTFSLTACGSRSTQEGFSKTGHVGTIKVTYSSEKPLVVGDNEMKVVLRKDAKPLTNAKVTFKIFMPEMPGMPAMQEVKTLSASGNVYSGNINFSMGGTWQVKIYIETGGKKYRYKSSVIL